MHAPNLLWFYGLSIAETRARMDAVTQENDGDRYPTYNRGMAWLCQNIPSLPFLWKDNIDNRAPNLYSYS